MERSSDVRDALEDPLMQMSNGGKPGLTRTTRRGLGKTMDDDRIAPPPPRVPAGVLDATSRRYTEAYERVTGRSLDDWYGHAA